MEQFSGLLSNGQLPYFADQLAAQLFVATIAAAGEPKNDQALKSMVAGCIKMAEAMDAGLTAQRAGRKDRG